MDRRWNRNVYLIYKNIGSLRVLIHTAKLMGIYSKTDSKIYLNSPYILQIAQMPLDMPHRKIMGTCMDNIDSPMLLAGYAPAHLYCTGTTVVPQRTYSERIVTSSIEGKR